MRTMDKLQPIYLSLLIFQQLVFPGCIQAATEKKAGYVTVPCQEHSFCWLYCQVVIDRFFGAGCCWEQKYTDANGLLTVIPILGKSCWCCTAPSVISVVPSAVDTFCDTLNPITNVTDALTSLVGNLCILDKVKCSMVTIQLNLNLLALDDNTCSSGGGVGNILTNLLSG